MEGWCHTSLTLSLSLSLSPSPTLYRPTPTLYPNSSPDAISNPSHGPNQVANNPASIALHEARQLFPHAKVGC